MSCLLRPSTSGAVYEIGSGQNDDSIQPADYRFSMPQRYGVGNEWRFTDVLWTRSSFPSKPGTSNGFNGLDSAHQQWEWNCPLTGTCVRKSITGTVVSANGVAVSGATVKLFNNATGLLVDTQTTAGDGSYTCGDPNNVACIAVAYLAGSPDTAGVTVNTVTGT